MARSDWDEDHEVWHRRDKRFTTYDRGDGRWILLDKAIERALDQPVGGRFTKRGEAMDYADTHYPMEREG